MYCCLNFCKLTKRKGPDRMSKTMDDIVKTVLNPDVHLPLFYAVDLSRLPPTDVNHCDMSAILLELQALRREVRDLKCLEQEVLDLREQVSRVERCTGRSAAEGTISDCDFPPLTCTGTVSDIRVPVAGTSDDGNAGKFAQLAKELHETGFTVVRNHRAKPKKEPVVGSSTSNKHVSSVTTTRVVDIFVSRLHPYTASADVEECVRTIGKDINITQVHCNKLKARYEHLYSSMHVEISVVAADFKRALDSFMKTESWPVGVFVKRYFKPKTDNGES